MSITMETDPQRWNPVSEYVRRFQQDFCTPTMPPLKILAASDRTWTNEEYRARKPKGFPATKRGVYLLFAPDESLLYVGVAMQCYDKRVWAHDEWGTRRYIDIIPFPDRWLALAVALEFYLIVALNPPENSIYRNFGFGTHVPIPSPANDANG